MDLDDARKPAAVTVPVGDGLMADATTNNNTAGGGIETTTIRTTTADVAVKPVLIKQGRSGKSGGKSSSKKQSKHLKWDEQAIEEHDLLRGTRMKIDEPNTPYTYYSDSGAESDDSKRQHQKSPANQKHTISWDSLQNRLDSVANVQQAQEQAAQAAQAQQQQQQYPSSPTSSFGGAETDASESGGEAVDHHKKEMRKLEFQDHRKRHYNEFQMIQKFRQEHPDDDEDDEDDDDADEEEGGADDGDADVED